MSDAPVTFLVPSPHLGRTEDIHPERIQAGPNDWAALSRFSLGEWTSDAQIDRLQSLGLLERVFGQALLTRLGRSTIGISE